ARHLEAVAVAGEHDLPIRQGAWPQVADRVGLRSLAGFRRAEVLRPPCGAGVRSEFLMRQAHDFPGLHMDLVDVRWCAAMTGPIRQVLELRVEDPFAIEGNER